MSLTPSHSSDTNPTTLELSLILRLEDDVLTKLRSLPIAEVGQLFLRLLSLSQDRPSGTGICLKSLNQFSGTSLEWSAILTQSPLTRRLEAALLFAHASLSEGPHSDWNSTQNLPTGHEAP